MAGKRQPIWKAEDRQGTKYFTKKPSYHGGHDIFIGDQITWAEILKARDKYFVMKKYKFTVLRPELSPSFEPPTLSPFLSENREDRLERLEMALKAILEKVDYTNGRCRAQEPIGSILTKEFLETIKLPLKKP